MKLIELVVLLGIYVFLLPASLEIVGGLDSGFYATVAAVLWPLTLLMALFKKTLKWSLK